MKIYIAHSSSFDFKKELYEPVKNNDDLSVHEFVFPHDGISIDSKKSISECGLVIAEVSYPSTGMGIELGWANMLGKPIACIYKKGTEPSSSLRYISKLFMRYESSEDLILHIQMMIAACPVKNL